MKPLVIPIFINNKGCPNRCVYCNESITAGKQPDIVTQHRFKETVDSYLEKSAGGNFLYKQIAFYGGNFTGIDKEYQKELLEYSHPYIENGSVNSIRISTRPDYIDKEQVSFLKKYGVTTVELGVQSMIDAVLKASRRGHTAENVRKATVLLKNNGIITGHHLMTGLPKDSREDFKYTVVEIIKLRPDMVRIHPTIVLQNTALADLYSRGLYQPQTMEEALIQCAYAVRMFENATIPVIRVGLQATQEMEIPGNIIAGPYHPAFRSLVDGILFYNAASAMLQAAKTENCKAVFQLSINDVSRFRGIRNRNIRSLKERFHLESISIEASTQQEKNTLIMRTGTSTYRKELFSKDHNLL